MRNTFQVWRVCSAGACPCGSRPRQWVAVVKAASAGGDEGRVIGTQKRGGLMGIGMPVPGRFGGVAM